MLLQARACAPTDGMESIAHSRAARRTATVQKEDDKTHVNGDDDDPNGLVMHLQDDDDNDVLVIIITSDIDSLKAWSLHHANISHSTTMIMFALLINYDHYSGHGTCTMPTYRMAWECLCETGWYGPGCDIQLEQQCDDKTDNDKGEKNFMLRCKEQYDKEP